MKFFFLYVVFSLLFLASCKKSETQHTAIAADSVVTQDSMVSGMSPQSPDADTVAPLDSTAYDTDSIKSSR